MTNEVERKWVAMVKDRAKFDKVTENWRNSLIQQFYIAISKDNEIRVRKETHANFMISSEGFPSLNLSGRVDYSVTVKRGEGQNRPEDETDFPPVFYPFLERLAVGTIICKRRRARSFGRIEVSIDEYQNPSTPADVVVLEVEFCGGYPYQCEEDAKKFTLFDLPQEIQDVLTEFNEVTDNSAFKNKNIAKTGMFPVI